MNFSSYTTKDASVLLAELNTSPSGLSHHEAENRLKTDGLNTLEGEKRTWTYFFLRQWKSAFIYLLVAAAMLAIALGETLDGAMIMLFVLINVALGFYQEYKSEKTLRLLKHYVVPRARVQRNGAETIVPSHELVKGDIVIVETGDVLPADIRFIEEQNLTIDESIISGESAPMTKESAPLDSPAGQIFEARNLGFTGTAVAGGRGVGVVYATGRETVLGDISRLTGETPHMSSFEKSLKHFSTFILRLVGITLLAIVAANLLVKGSTVDVSELIIFAIALAVSVIPEALPLVTTFSLSRGALRLAKHHVVVKRLSAIEDLGGIDVLCTDKTGTLTENKLTVAEIYACTNQTETLTAASLASPFLTEKNQQPNNAFDIALWQRLTADQQQSVRQYERVGEIPFDPVRRRNAVVVHPHTNGIGVGAHEHNHENKLLLISRGAPEDILDLCSRLDPEKRKETEGWMTSEGKKGHRVIAIASKNIKALHEDVTTDEQNLALIGCVSFVDQLKSTTARAVKDAKSLGVALKILTGDSPEVAGVVGHQIGLTKSPKEVITGAQLLCESHERQHELAEKYSVFARVSPEQKYAIIKLLQKNHEVGFLGEGINDAPALKAANVALVVDHAADIAREAADIVLLKKNLEVTIDGIREGREIFSNTVKYIKATLASNFGNFYAVAIASLLIDFLPMLPLQILLVNLLSDFPMIAIATDTVDPSDIARPRRYDIKEIAMAATLLGIVSTIFDFIFFALFFRMGPSTLQTNWFIASIITELLFLFSIRTRRLFWKATRPSGLILGLSLGAALATVITPLTSFGQRIFDFARPHPVHLMLIGGLALVYLAVSEIVKRLYYRHLYNHPTV